MKNFIAILILVLTTAFFQQNIAQISINGIITDANHNPLNNALVEIYDQKDSLNKYVTATDLTGYFQISNITDIQNIKSNLPDEYLILRNYPNPFNPSTIIYFELPEAGNIKVKIYDILGREVRSLFTGFHNAGTYEINWDGNNNFNQTVSAGIYLCQLKTKSHFKVHKMVLLDGGSSGVGFGSGKLTKQTLVKNSPTNSIFNFTVKVTGDSLSETYFRNLVCSGDTSLSLIVPKIFKKETIGPNGGVVGNDFFKISIPAGAFGGNYDISISKVEDDGAFGENNSTPIYKINGIPISYKIPINISIKKNDSSIDNQLIAIGQNFLSTETIIYTFFESYDSNGYINSKLPVPEDSNVTNSQTKVLGKINIENYLPRYIRNSKNWFNKLGTDHFLIYYPSNWDNKRVIMFRDYLEEAYQKVYDLGFRYNARTNWPIEITFCVQVEDGLTSNSLYGNNYGYINFSSGLLNQMPNAHVTAAHEFFHLVQYLYDQRNSYSKSKFRSNFHWVNEACSAWLEEKVSDKINYIPDVWKDNKLSPLEGLQILPNTSDDQIIDHGYGLSALIKYLVSKFGEGILLDIYNDLKNGKHPVDAVCRTEENKIGEFEYPVEWWEDFLKEYILGNVYSDVSLSEWTDKFKTGNFEILTDTDTLETFINNYQDLSGKLFTVSLNYPEIDQSSQIIFEVSGANKRYLTLFKYNDKVLEYLATDYDQIVVDDVKTLTQNDWNFLALVSNNRYSQPYTSMHDINLNIEVKKVSQPALPSTTCTLGLMNVNINKHTIYSDTGPEDETKLLNFVSFTVNGQFYGNTFKGTYEDGVDYDTIVVTLNESLDKIIYLSRHLKHDSGEDPSVRYTFDFYLTASEIELSVPQTINNSMYVFERDGIDACNSISDFNYSGTDKVPQWNSSWSTEIQCTDNSKIQITFRNE